MPCSLNYEMKRLREARHPISLWTPFRFVIGPRFSIAMILSGLASMPRLEANPKGALFGIELYPEFPEVDECGVQDVDQLVNLL